MIAKTKEDVENLRMAGKVLAEVLREVAALAKPGVSTAALDLAAEGMIRERGAAPAFLNYKPDGAAYPFPAALCVSIDDEVVHGIPSEKRVIVEGQLVMLDLGLSYKGYFSDAAVTVCAGVCDAKGKSLINATHEAFEAALKAAKPGNRIGDMSSEIERVARERGFSVVTELGGHSLGLTPHEAPFVPNAGRAGEGELLTEGLVLAIEPIFAEGRGEVVLADDEWTYHTKDGSRSAETEHTILITKDGAEVLTR